MKRSVGILCLSCAFCACAHDVAGVKKAAQDGHSAVSPDVSKSDKKFFGKDFPWDKRPKVDVLHFKHPYPAVEDSDDFDKDFIKDENSDNGSWKAQSEYDRLRHKLAKEKENLAKAQSATDEAGKELKDVMKRAQDAEENTRKVAQKKTEEAKSPVTLKSPKVKRDRKGPAPIPDPEPIAAPGDVEAASSDTEKAMGALEECKKQLAEAREKLKEKMKELEMAKKEQKETQAAYEKAKAESKADDEASAGTQNAIKSDYQQYMDAREDYLKQQALVAKMEADIKVASEKVRAIRDEEDARGGVYNTHPKSAAPSPVSSSLGAFAVMMVAYLA